MQISYKMIQNLIKLLIIIGAIVLVVLILLDRNSAQNSNNSTTPTSSNMSSPSGSKSNPYAVLPPATVAPKVQECSQTVGYGSNGVPSPLTCINGYLNIEAWNAISAQEPKVMSLGYSPSAAVVQAAVCSDISAAASDSAPGADNALEASAFQISSIYYGWNLGSASSYVSKC